MRISRSRKLRAPIVVALLVVTAVVVLVVLPHEPSYKGKSLSFWLDQLPILLISTNSTTMMMPGTYRTTAGAKADEARRSELARQAKEAVDAIGTNGLPTIVARLCARDTKANQTLENWGVRSGLLGPRIMTSTEQRRGQALYALSRLSDRARPIAPSLIALTNSENAAIRAAAVHALTKVAPEYASEKRR